MEDKIKEWSQEYSLKDLKIVGYQGGYPMIQFRKENHMRILTMSKQEIDKIVKKAEIYGGIELGVMYNLRKSAFIMVYDEIIVICGHEFVLERILEKII